MTFMNCILHSNEIILKFVPEKENSENYFYVLDLLNVKHYEEFAVLIEDAVKQFEDMVVNHIQEEINYYEEMLDEFQEKHI